MDTLLASPLLTAHGFAHGFGTRLTAEHELPAPWLATQVHGTRVHTLQAGDARAAIAELQVDGLISAPGHAAVAVRTADCVPVLLAHRERGTVAAVHAGWRGVHGGIVGLAAAALGPAEQLLVALGPCIGPCCFEVGDEVADALGESGGAACVRRLPGRRPHVDLHAALRHQLQQLHITQIDARPECTRCDAARFHSYRRDAGDAGRMRSFIAPRGA